MARNDRSTLRETIDAIKRCRDAKRLYDSDSRFDTVAAVFLVAAAGVSILVALSDTDGAGGGS